MSKKIVVTGGCGGAGSYVVRELMAHDYEVLVLDIVPPREDNWHFKQVDLTEYAAVVDALSAYDAAVHFASNPEPDFDFATGAERFRNNTLCTYNVFNAACALAMDIAGRNSTAPEPRERNRYRIGFPALLRILPVRPARVVD